MERKGIDACFVVAPDHWNVPISLDAVRSGKGVYVEKSMSLTAYFPTRFTVMARFYRSAVSKVLDPRSAKRLKSWLARCYGLSSQSGTYSSGAGSVRP